LRSPIDLVVGLGNPGPDYEHTRHNIGFWFVDALALTLGVPFKLVNRFHGRVAEVSFAAHPGRLFKPVTYMNRSGQAVAALSKYYKIAVENILVVHDEIDLPPGTIRLKQGGGDGGHNGLRDIVSALEGNRDFLRLRIGVGHPGSADDVVDYVLQKPSRHDKEIISSVINNAIGIIPMIVAGETEKAMNELHRRTAPPFQDPQ
jgi:peptidyl-tRNA hydrolase, PTH1 family